ncbi:MAG: hypothetical protein V2I82_03930 [Halieaceae bacterium]|jgi:hypothetical protein|nr:hypothetical protein [Halieaceae bacterium]
MPASLIGRYREVPEHLRLERRVELVGLGLVALLLLLLLLVLLSLLRSSSVERLAPSADSIAVADVYSEESVSSVESLEIRARPLFWASRRPEITMVIDPAAVAAEEAASAAAQDLKPLKFQVSGIFAAGTDDAGFIAAMKEEVRRVYLGDTIEGWTVSRIGPTEVELFGAGTRRTVTMERRPISAAAGVTAAPAQDDGSDQAERPAVDLSRLSLGGRRPPPTRPQRAPRQGRQGQP